MVQKFINQYGENTLNAILDIFLDDNHSECSNEICNNQRCVLKKAFLSYLKYVPNKPNDALFLTCPHSNIDCDKYNFELKKFAVKCTQCANYLKKD